MSSQRWISFFLGFQFVIWLSGCATNPSPDASGPRSDAPAYPVLLLDDDGDRRATALATWSNFTRRQGMTNAPAPDLQPVTATLRSIPTLSEPLYLPKVGESGPMNEEETRELLRRLIADAGQLLCGEPQQVSLIQRIDGADGIKEAHYQQRPFRYPLRGGFGELRIAFTGDRRIVRLSSTCIPDTERIRRGFVGLGTQRITAEKAISNLAGQALNYTDKNGQKQIYYIKEADKLAAHELVVYPVERQGTSSALEFHVAWEFRVADKPGLSIYVDSITGDVLGIEQL